MDLEGLSKSLLSGMAEIVRDLNPANALENLEPLDVAKGLITIYDKLQPWVKAARLEYLSSTTIQLRQIFKNAHDPLSLIFNDIPRFAINNEDTGSDEDVEKNNIYIAVRSSELIDAYPNMMGKLRTMLDELGVPNTSETAPLSYEVVPKISRILEILN